MRNHDADPDRHLRTIDAQLARLERQFLVILTADAVS
jgi:hypothetical protein